jgi:tetratricopeptide (TPR) repeat protein
MLLAAEKTIDEIGFSTPYLKELKSITNQKDLYAVYLKQRSKYANVPSYFVDVYDYIKDYNIELANRILSNIAEIDTDNYELLKVYAYKLEEQNNYQLAVFVYRQVLKLRPEDSQSYRDLALALQETGAYNEALDLLNSIASEKIYKGNQRRNFKGLKDITINEMRNIIHTNNISYDIEGFPLKVSHNYDMDIRVVIDWNHNDTDIDLHIIDPNLEECSYTYTKTKSGGEISKDMTKGFGPEEFKQKFSYKGFYYVKVNYYGDRYQKIETPTFMKVTIFRNYGRVNQEKEVKVIRLTGRSKKHLVERIAIL